MKRKSFLKKSAIGAGLAVIAPLSIVADPAKKDPIQVWKDKGALWPDYVEVREYGMMYRDETTRPATNLTSALKEEREPIKNDVYKYYLLTFVPIDGVEGGGMIFRRNAVLAYSPPSEINGRNYMNEEMSERSAFFISIDEAKRKANNVVTK